MSDENKNNQTPEAPQKEAGVVKLSDMISKKRTEKNVLSEEEARSLRRRGRGSGEPMVMADRRPEPEAAAPAEETTEIPVEEPAARESAATEKKKAPSEDPVRARAKKDLSSDEAFARLRAAAGRKTRRDVTVDEAPGKTEMLRRMVTSIPHMPVDDPPADEYDEEEEAYEDEYDEYEEYEAYEEEVPEEDEEEEVRAPRRRRRSHSRPEASYREFHLPLRVKIRLVFVLLLLIAAAAAASLRITHVTYEGSSRYTDEQLTERIFGEGFAANPIIFKVNEKLNGRVEIPFVEKYQVTLTGPDSAEVTIYEKVIAGCVDVMGSYMYFDKAGYVVENDTVLREDIPLVVGLKSDSVVLHEKITGVRDDVFQEILNITLELQKASLTWGGAETSLAELLDALQFDTYYHVTCVFGDLKVYLGDSKHMEEKLLEMYDILPKLEGKAGTLYLDTFDPLASEPGYLFKDRAVEEAEAAAAAEAEARESDPAYIEQAMEAAQNEDEKRAQEAADVDLKETTPTEPVSSAAETNPVEAAEEAPGEAPKEQGEEPPKEPEGQENQEEDAAGEGQDEAPAAQ